MGRSSIEGLKTAHPRYISTMGLGDEQTPENTRHLNRYSAAQTRPS